MQQMLRVPLAPPRVPRLSHSGALTLISNCQDCISVPRGFRFLLESALLPEQQVERERNGSPRSNFQPKTDGRWDRSTPGSPPRVVHPQLPHQGKSAVIHMTDTLDDIFDGSDDEEESQDIVNQVLDEIGIEISGKV